MTTPLPEPNVLGYTDQQDAILGFTEGDVEALLKIHGAAEYKRAIDDVLHILTTMRMREGTLGKAIKLLGETS